MKLQNKKGFTLIELLVVITIIGILATGGVSIFTKQLQGARDTNRLNAIKLLESANHQYYSDASEFPDASSSGAYKSAVGGYVTNFPSDPKPNQNICWLTGSTNTTIGATSSGPCGVWYGRANDDNGLLNARFKLGVTLEKKENAGSGVASKDNGQIGGMYEVFGGEGGSGTNLTMRLY